MRTGADIPPPFGFIEFCARFPGECRATDDRAPRQIHLDQRLKTTLESINRSVNRSIKPFRDIDLYGTEEHWTYPQEAGDCEDYALLKRQRLKMAGWPESALLLTVAYDEHGEAHTILLIVTDQAELVLDNKTDAVLPWQITSYRWLMRQSGDDPMRWVRILG